MFIYAMGNTDNSLCYSNTTLDSLQIILYILKKLYIIIYRRKIIFSNIQQEEVKNELQGLR